MELLEIEKEFRRDGEKAMRKYDAVLVRLGERLADAMTRGVAPAQFHRLEQLGEAVTIARKVMRLQLRDNANDFGTIPENPTNNQ